MANNPDAAEGKQGEAVDKFAVAAPKISLPKGGGAIRGIGEKFAANPVTGTGSMTVPIATSPGRSGFGPQLSLSYDSGAGNGPFGFGWSARPARRSPARPTRACRTTSDAEESDVFILSGAEDLVPVLAREQRQVGARRLPSRTVYGEQYRIHRYRPRSRGPVRADRALDQPRDPQRTASGARSPRTTSRPCTARPRRAASPTRPIPRRIFSWLICESYDDKGNAIVYGTSRRTRRRRPRRQAHERNRTDATPLGQPLSQADPVRQPHAVLPGSDPDRSRCRCRPTGVSRSSSTTASTTRLLRCRRTTGKPWACRHDPFSSYRAGFEVRTYRLCRRVLMFHHFPDEPGVGPTAWCAPPTSPIRYDETPADRA